MPELFDQITTQANDLRACVSSATQSLSEFKRRLEAILSQDHREIAIRDTDFQTHFTDFCTQLRQQTDLFLQTWQQLREQVRTAKQVPSSLQAKGFSLWAKTLSRASDEFTTAFDQFHFVYKKYTLTKLPVWVLNSCETDLSNLASKILFLSREITKKANGDKGEQDANG